MASIADLNVRLGLIYKDFDRGLETVERRLRSSGRRLSGLGDQLTVAISLPLAAAGAAAVKSAGDIESLQLALESQLGSTEKARKELELLRIEALKPGLGFEQAVRASVSLQAVGFEAEKARKITSEFGNALALAGKGAAELDGVVLALTQITAKGIVSAEEINQIAERLPQIRTLMQQAFGTASTEAIQKLGISSQQFIAGITSELQKLPRATGGIKNSLENFFDAIKVGAAKFGLAISKALDLPNTLEGLAAGLSSLADGFSNLNPEVQKYIVFAAAALIATGPLVKVYAALKTTGAQAISMFRDMGAVTKSIAAGAINAASAFQKLNIAMKFTVVGAVIAGVTALYLAFNALSESMTEAKRVAKSVESVNRQAADSIVEERLRAEALIGVLKDQNSTRAKQKAALNELKAISPDYFGRLDLEKTKVGDLNSALDQYVNSLSRAATAQAAFDRKKEIAKELNNLGEIAEPTVLETAGNAFLSLGNASSFAGRQVETFNENYTKKRAALEAENKAMDEVIKKNTELGVVLGNTTNSIKTNNLALGQAGSLSKVYKEVLSDIANLSAQQDLLGAKNVVDQADAIEAGIKKLLDAGFKPASVEIQNLKAQLQGLFTGIKGPEVTPIESAPLPELVAQKDPKKGIADSIVKAVEPMQTAGQQIAEIQEKIRLGTVDVATGFQNIANVLNTTAPTMVAALAAAGAAMVDLAAAGNTSFAALGNAALKSAADVVRAAMMKAVASYIGDAFVKFGIFGGFIAAGASAIVGTIFNKALKGLKVPAFATGTNFHKGGLAITSEKGPELLNLPRGTQVTPNASLDRLISNASGSNNFVVTHKIQGSDLLFIIERAQSQSKRIRGF